MHHTTASWKRNLQHTGKGQNNRLTTRKDHFLPKGIFQSRATKSCHSSSLIKIPPQKRVKANLLIVISLLSILWLQMWRRKVVPLLNEAPMHEDNIKVWKTLIKICFDHTHTYSTSELTFITYTLKFCKKNVSRPHKSINGGNMMKYCKASRCYSHTDNFHTKNTFCATDNYNV